MQDVHPERIGPYRISGILGQGGMGAVYRAVHQDTPDTVVAVKVLKSSMGKGSEERFIAEAKVLRSIDHPNVIRCLDVGRCEQGLYMALEFLSGGDVGALIQQYDNRLPETRALSIVRDVARGLEALEEAGLVHRDIKPENIFITEDGSAKLADFGVVRMLAGAQQLTQPGMPVGTVSYMAPEQAQASIEVDTRADIYALGATLFAMLAGRPPFLGENPMMTMLMVVEGRFPDLKALRPDCSAATVNLINKSTHLDPKGRYQHAQELREVIAGIIEHLHLEPQEATPRPLRRQKSSKVSNGESIPENNTLCGQVMLDALDAQGLQRILQRVRVAEDELSAWINLAPETRFPSELLRAVLARRAIVYGLREGALLDASRSSPSPRRLVLAQGDLPSPGCTGRNIFGHPVPALQESVITLINDDCTQAYLLTAPNSLPTRQAVQEALVKAGVRFGILKDALARSWEGPASPSGRSLIARAMPMQTGRPPGFRLACYPGDGIPDAMENLHAVHKGDIIACWDEGSPGQSGMDVCGNPIPIPAIQALSPEEQAGEGTDIGRDRSGNMVLRALRDGHVQERSNGVIRVVRILEIDGDLGVNDEGVCADDVVVVRGTVRAGARISCSNDVVIMGDLENACVDAGGSLEVHGDIQAGRAPIVGVDAVLVQGAVQRRVVAGNLRIEGTVSHCELVATGNISAHRVVGGSLTAGGSVEVQYAGDESGTSTELWAGRNLPYDDQEKMARLAERRLNAERLMMIEECHALHAQLDTQEKRGLRLEGAIRPDALHRHQSLLKDLQRRWEEAEAARENSRQRLAGQRQLLRELSGLAHNADCSVVVSVLAKAGVVARIADTDPLRLRKDRHRLHLSLKDFAHS